MRILKRNLKAGEVLLEVNNLEDLWYLSHVINPGDKVRMKSERKIKLNDGSDTNVKIIRKWIWLTLQLDKVSYLADQLRLKGIVIDGPEDVARGSYHTFGIEENSQLQITKTQWPKFLLNKLDEACNRKIEPILIVLFDREEASFALLKPKGIEKLGELKGNVSKKNFDQAGGKDFYIEISQLIEKYDSQYKISHIIAASPAFWKDYLEKALSNVLLKKTIFTTTSSVHPRAFLEVVKRPEVSNVLKDEKASKEETELATLLKAIDDDLACYGLKDVKTSAESGAIKTLLVTNNFLQKKKDDDSFSLVDAVLNTADQTNAEIIIISTDNASKIIDGLGGIAGVLRWKI